MDKEEKEAMIAGARSLLQRLKEAEGQYALTPPAKALLGALEAWEAEEPKAEAPAPPFKPLLELKRDGKSKFALERGCAKAEVEITEWIDMEGDGTEIEPFVLIRLEWHVEDTEMSCVWGWWTDHYWKLISDELPEFLRRFCPAPEEVWECLCEAVAMERRSE